MFKFLPKLESTYFGTAHLPRLQLTGWRFGAGAAFPHYLSNPHFPPPLRQTAVICWRFHCAFSVRFTIFFASVATIFLFAVKYG
jgi:hypothetical protein